MACGFLALDPAVFESGMRVAGLHAYVHPGVILHRGKAVVDSCGSTVSFVHTIAQAAGGESSL